MAEYIEREKVGGCLNGLLNDLMDDTEHTEEFARGFEQALRYVWDKVADIPSADVRPVRHGHWDTGYFHDRVCNCCLHPDNDLSDYAHAYCPHCGAKMDGKEDSDD